jgi:5-methylcytosine-specific restriction protein A
MANWTEDELILAGALVVRNGWRERRTEDPEVIELSALLRSLPLHDQSVRTDPKFRSPGSVSRKTGDFMTNHPAYHGAATKGGGPTKAVIQAFVQDEAYMLSVARTLEENARTGLFAALPALADEDFDEATAMEGKLITRLIRTRERDPKLRRAKIRRVLEKHGRLACEVCGFDFEKTYGVLGREYIEVHHVAPLHVVGHRETKLEDLACLCSNCHRMCHRRHQGERWRTPADLRALLQGE